MPDLNLKRTLIIPEDGPLAIRLFEQAVADLDVVLFVILGKEFSELTSKTDWRARALPTRQCVWVLDPKLPELKEVVDFMKNGDDKIIAATYSKTDQIVQRLTATDIRNSLRIETAFSKADNSF
jgi:hypothetical protein